MSRFVNSEFPCSVTYLFALFTLLFISDECPVRRQFAVCYCHNARNEAQVSFQKQSFLTLSYVWHRQKERRR